MPMTSNLLFMSFAHPFFLNSHSNTSPPTFQSTYAYKENNSHFPDNKSNQHILPEASIPFSWIVYNMFRWHICCYAPKRICNAYSLLFLSQAFSLETHICFSYAYLFFQLFPPELSSLPRSDCSLIRSNTLSDSPAVLANENNTIRTIITNAILNPIITLSSFLLVPYRQK